ncbi:MAG: hypothetical protein NVSMB42_13290 [Herpetosiphon sp.]
MWSGNRHYNGCLADRKASNTVMDGYAPSFPTLACFGGYLSQHRLCHMLIGFVDEMIGGPAREIVTDHAGEEDDGTGIGRFDIGVDWASLERIGGNKEWSELASAHRRDKGYLIARLEHGCRVGIGLINGEK